MDSDMKLYVWDEEGTLQDYTSGMICVLAHNLEEALEKIKEKCDYCSSNFDVSAYKIIETPEAFISWGGG